MIAAGSYHNCAIATDNTITCWGANDTGQTDAPSGTYTAISAGWGHSCAIATDNTITCWGGNHVGQTDAPQGSYQTISAGLGPQLRHRNRQHHHLLGNAAS